MPEPAKPALGTSASDELFSRALRVIPGGVNSPVRAFKSVGGTPYFVERAEGAYVWDVDGNRYVDFVQSYGASILGHAHPGVVEAVSRAASRGTSYGAPTRSEVLLAEEISARVPGADMVRLVNSGTEATMSALRVARAATGRDRVVTFAGCYHGHSDGLLASGGSGVATLGLASSAGVTKAAVSDTVVAPYNTVPVLDELVAAVIVEPVAANMGLVAPVPGFLEGLRSECDRVGALLIFDEVITGFRLAYGGASEVTGVAPDLWCFGKVIGGGLPLAAFAGSRDLMEHLAPVGPVYQAGTLSGNPLATAAGLAVLAALDRDVYDELALRVGRFAGQLADVAGPGVQVPVYRTLLGVFFGEAPVADFTGATMSASTGRYPALMHGLLDRGVAIAPGAYEVMFPSLAHSEDDYERAVEAFSGALE